MTYCLNMILVWHRKGVLVSTGGNNSASHLMSRLRVDLHKGSRSSRSKRAVPHRFVDMYIKKAAVGWLCAGRERIDGDRLQEHII